MWRLIGCWLMLAAAVATKAANCPWPEPVRRVAVIGGGIAGTSFSEFLQQHAPGQFEVSIFEKEETVGGRTSSIEVGSWGVMEKGAGIVHSSNQLLLELIESFEMETVTVPADDRIFRGGLGGHDGEPASLDSCLRRDGDKADRWRIWLDEVKYKPLTHALSKFLREWSRVYDIPDSEVFESPSELFEKLGVDGLMDIDGREWLDGMLLPESSIQALEATNRRHYGQGLDMNALATAVSLSGSWGPIEVLVGELQSLPEALAESSAYKVWLEHEITRIESQDHKLFLRGARFETRGPYDAVVIAAPLEMKGESKDSLDLRPLMQCTDDNVLCPINLKRTYAERPQEQRGEARVWQDSSCRCLSYTGNPPDSAKGIMEVCLKDETSEHQLERFASSLDWNLEHAADFSAGNRRIIKEVHWTPAFINAKPRGDEEHLTFHTPLKGVYWISAMEAYVSTMETQMIAAQNVARLVAKEVRCNSANANLSGAPAEDL